MRFRLIRLFFALLLLCPVAAAGQDALDRLIASSRTGRLEFDYSFSSGLDTRMTGRGHALVQGECFFINGNGLEIYCDGKTAASIDRESKEVIIESIEGEDCGNYINPASLITYIDKHFRRKFCIKTNYAGLAVLKYVLEPVRETGISRISLFVSTDGKKLFGASVSTVDAGSTDFNISDFRVLPAGALSDFVLDCAGLGPSYIITDLR